MTQVKEILTKCLHEDICPCLHGLHFYERQQVTMLEIVIQVVFRVGIYRGKLG